MGQTKAEVKSALADYFGKDQAKKTARAQFESWGDKAIGPLRALAKEGSRGRVAGVTDWALVCALAQIKSVSALELVVEILNHKTRLDPGQAMSQVVVLVGDADARLKLEDLSGFRAGVRRFAVASSWLSRSRYLDVVAKLGWEDAAVTVRRLLKDQNLSVRRKAASTLAVLTGESVKVLEPPLVFRKRKLRPGLLGEPELIPYKNGWATRVACFTQDSAGKPCLLWGRGKRFRRFDGEGAQGELVLGQFGHAMLSLARGKNQAGVQMVTLVADKQHGGARYALGRTVQGETLWTYKPPTAGIADAALLFDRRGAYGVALAVGGPTGILALDGGGQEVWQLPNKHVAYGVRTHASLPGHLLFLGGSFSLVRHQRGRSKVEEEVIHAKGFQVFAQHGCLFPDAKGKPAILVAGTSTNSEPVIARFDAAGKFKWRAIVPSKAGGMAMLETSDWGRLFAVVTGGGQLLVFDGDATLRYQAELPNPKQAETLFCYGLSAGQIDASNWAVVVHLLGRSYLYRVENKH